MKPALCILLVFLFSCKKNYQGRDASKISITHISEIGNLQYQNDRLQSIGKTILLYDNNGLLTGTRTEQSDSSVVPLHLCCTTDPDRVNIKTQMTKYSYLRSGNVIVGALLDSLVSSTESAGGPPAESDPLFPHIPNVNILTNMPRARFFYSGTRLDSVEYLFKTENNPVSKSIFEYDQSGDITRQTDHYFAAASPSIGIPLLLFVPESVTTYEYDNQYNPWHLLFRQTGVILPVVENKNISPHNPVKATTKFIVNGEELTGTTYYDYDYNAAGFPTRITTGKGTSEEQTVFLYYN